MVEENAAPAAAITPRKKSGPPKGPYGPRLNSGDRENFLNALRLGATLGAAAALIGVSRITVERWRQWGLSGVPKYKRLLYDMERARGNWLRRLYSVVAVGAVGTPERKDEQGVVVSPATPPDPKLALDLLRLIDPDLVAQRMAGRRTGTLEVEAEAAAAAGEGDAKAAARIRYRLTWENDGEPLSVPGVTDRMSTEGEAAEPFLPALPAAGGNGDDPKKDGSGEDLD